MVRQNGNWNNKKEENEDQECAHGSSCRITRLKLQKTQGKTVEKPSINPKLQNLLSSPSSNV